jgi:hypothetical protein
LLPGKSHKIGAAILVGDDKIDGIVTPFAHASSPVREQRPAGLFLSTLAKNPERAPNAQRPGATTPDVVGQTICIPRLRARSNQRSPVKFALGGSC